MCIALIWNGCFVYMLVNWTIIYHVLVEIHTYHVASMCSMSKHTAIISEVLYLF